jgi:hypothetical protein
VCKQRQVPAGAEKAGRPTTHRAERVRDARQPPRGPAAQRRQAAAAAAAAGADAEVPLQVLHRHVIQHCAVELPRPQRRRAVAQRGRGAARESARRGDVIGRAALHGGGREQLLLQHQPDLGGGRRWG